MEANILQQQAPQTLLVISAGDLQNFAKSVVTETAAALKAEAQPVPITPTQAARYLEIGDATLWRWDKEGYLVARRKGGRKYYLQADLDAIKAVRK